MKKFLSLATVLVSFLLLSARPAEAKVGIPIIYSTGTLKVVKVADFPDSSDFRDRTGVYVDAGYRFEQVQLFWLPLWNYGGNWCGYMGKSDEYFELSKAELDSMAKSVNVTLPESPSLGFWNVFGGKLILGLLLVAGVAVFFMKSDDT